MLQKGYSSQQIVYNLVEKHTHPQIRKLNLKIKAIYQQGTFLNKKALVSLSEIQKGEKAVLCG